MKDIYEYAIKNLPRTSLLEVVDNVFEGKALIENLDWKYPIYPFFYIKEDFDNTPSKNDMREAHAIYIILRNTILANVSKDEKDIISLYATYGSYAHHAVDIDEKRLSEFNKFLNNNCMTAKTKYGKLIFEFVDRNKYGVGDKTLCAFDTDTKHILLFLDDQSAMTTLDLINILRRRNRFIHELSHYIDDINENLSYEKYNDTEEGEIAYINDPSEFKADAQAIVYSFGGYLFKNQNKFKKYNLMNENDIDELFNIFLTDNSYDNVVDSQDLSNFRIRIEYWYPENREKFYNFLHKTILDTQDKVDYSESERRNNVLKLMTLEETFLENGVMM